MPYKESLGTQTGAQLWPQVSSDYQRETEISGTGLYNLSFHQLPRRGLRSTRWDRKVGSLWSCYELQSEPHRLLFELRVQGTQPASGKMTSPFLVRLWVKVACMLKGDAYCNAKRAHTSTYLEVSKPAMVKVIWSHTGSMTTDNGKPLPGTVRLFCDP